MLNNDYNKKKSSISIPKENLGIDYFADLLREPPRSAKVYKKIAFNERVHLMKISEFEKRKLKLINSRYVEKNRLIERLNYYEEKLQLLRSQSKSISHFATKTDDQTSVDKSKPVQFLTRSQSMLIDKENKEKFSQTVLIEAELVNEKKKTFLTSMEKFERESTNSSISLFQSETARAKTSSKKQLNVRFQMDQATVLSRSKTYMPHSLPFLPLPKNKTKSDLSNSSLSRISSNKNPTLKEKYSITSHLSELIPVDLGDFDTFSFASHRLLLARKKIF
jgi:hypothetical protein